jgi:chromosome segregation ATPase
MNHINEDEYTRHYSQLDDNHRKTCLDKHNKNFDMCVKQSDEMYNNAQEVMKHLTNNLNAKNQQVKTLKHDIKHRKHSLAKLSHHKNEVGNNLTKISKQNEKYKDRKDIKIASSKLSKEVNRLLTEKLDLQKFGKKVKEQIKMMQMNQTQLKNEMNNDVKEVEKLKERLNGYSFSYNQNKQLSESVNLGQSRLESFLNCEKETRQELLCEVNQRKKTIQRFKSMNKSFNSDKFISSDFDLESKQSIESQFNNFDFVDLSNEPFQPTFEKEYRSMGGSTAEYATMATKRSLNTVSDQDTRSMVEK